MSAHCHHHHHDHHAESASAPPSPAMRRVLWFALVVNAAMFALEVTAGVVSGSLALLADAVDFFGDALNYALSLAVLGVLPLWRSRAAWLKGATMGAFGIWVLASAVWKVGSGAVPEPITMGVVGVAALAANLAVAAALYRWRGGDANMQSAWLCSRNDAIGNLAVLAAAAGVFGTGSAWPDLIVASIMGALALRASVQVMRLAGRELRVV
jgi:Co/Zn/Cd efflux system component